MYIEWCQRIKHESFIESFWIKQFNLHWSYQQKEQHTKRLYTFENINEIPLNCQRYSWRVCTFIIAALYDGVGLDQLTYWGQDKMGIISQTIFSHVFSWMDMFEFWLKLHWSLFLKVQLTIFQHWFRWWVGAVQATSHYLNQWRLVYWRIYVSLGLNELIMIFNWSSIPQVFQSQTAETFRSTLIRHQFDTVVSDRF